MKLELIKKKEIWQSFIKENEAGILQSWQWKDFQDSLNAKTYPFVLKENKEILLAALILKKDLIFNKSYLYIPRGPIFKNGLSKDKKNEIFLSFIEKVKEKFQKDGVIFIKIEPRNKLSSNGYNIIKTKPRQPEETAILDLTPTEQEILQNMHSKKRYNIRLAKRKGVKTKKSKDVKDLKIFLNLLDITTDREGFKGYSNNYYKKLLNLKNVNLYLAFYKEKPVAAHIVSVFGKYGYYLHGASSREHRKVMAPHLLHFKIIQDLKEDGVKYYDFWGIDDKKWPGLTRFKMNFGCYRKKYLGTFDLILKPAWYLLYILASKIKS